MKFSLFTCLFYFIFLLPLSSQESSTRKNHTDDNGLRQGYWERKYPNGNIQYHGTFRDDHPVGELVRYFPNGNKLAVLVFCSLGKRAEAKLFYEGGNLAAMGIYVDEQKDSVWKYYSFYNDNLISTVTYNMGVKEGQSTVYYPNGRISESFWYESGSRNGPWLQYYENGKVRVKSEFKNDQRHGDFIFYSPGGRTEMKGSYDKNQMHGEWIFYGESGNVVSVINYVEGRADNEDELIDREQEMFREIEQMRGRIPEPDESEIFSPRRHY